MKIIEYRNQNATIKKFKLKYKKKNGKNKLIEK